jgi:hypothetical protein
MASLSFPFVTRRNLRYRMDQLKTKGKHILSSETCPPTNTFVVEGKGSTTSSNEEMTDLTNGVSINSSDIGNDEDEVDVNIETETDESQKSKRGRKEGSTNSNIKLHLQQLKEAISKAATSYVEEKSKMTTKTPNHCLENIICKTEEEYGLPNGTINLNTMKSQIRRGNLSGIAHQNVLCMKLSCLFLNGVSRWQK